MNYKKLNFISNFYFGLIFLSGLFYVALLVIAFGKMIPAMLMQIIFLLDALKFGDNIFKLVTSRLFLINIVPGIFLIGLISQFSKTLIKSIKNIWYGNRFINNLEIIKTNKEFFKFNSNESLIFTSGFLKPRIFISSALFKTHTLDEIKAMTQHEMNHRNNFHPVKIFTANFIKSVLPIVPGKNWLIDNYLTLVEVSSDQFSENKINNKLPLVSALLKFQHQNFEPISVGVNYFNSQSERIKILVGKKKQWTRIPIAYYSLVLVVILSGTFMMKNSNIFFDCQHLIKCVEILMTPDSPSLITSVNSPTITISPSDHCQQFGPLTAF